MNSIRRRNNIFIALRPDGVAKLAGSEKRVAATEVSVFMGEVATAVIAKLQRAGIKATRRELQREGPLVLLPLMVSGGDLDRAVAIVAGWVRIPRAAKLRSGATPKVRLFVP